MRTRAGPPPPSAFILLLWCLHSLAGAQLFLLSRSARRAKKGSPPRPTCTWKQPVARRVRDAHFIKYGDRPSTKPVTDRLHACALFFNSGDSKLISRRKSAVETLFIVAVATYCKNKTYIVTQDNNFIIFKLKFQNPINNEAD